MLGGSRWHPRWGPWDLTAKLAQARIKVQAQAGGEFEPRRGSREEKKGGEKRGNVFPFPWNEADSFELQESGPFVPLLWILQVYCVETIITLL